MTQNVPEQPPEVEPSVTHYTAHGDPQTWCGVSLTDPAVGDVTQDRALVTCPPCARQLVDEHLFDAARTAEDEAWAALPATEALPVEMTTPHGFKMSIYDELQAYGQCGICGQPESGPLHVASPAPERRTVSLEVLTDELRALLPASERDTGRVGVVLRVGGRPSIVPDTDAPWQIVHNADPLKILRGLISEMISGAARMRYGDGQAVDLLMPTPDVLAALDGRPDATFWTADVQLRADQVAGGWLIIGWASEGDAALVTDIDECADPKCPWHGSCTVITAGGAEPVHTPDFSDVTVRIPAAVTR